MTTIPHTLTLPIFVCIILSSCNLQRKRQQLAQSETVQIRSSQHNRDSSYLHLTDSSQRYWSFWTDGWLYYHPDSGLLAQGGQLYLNESLRAEKMMTHIQTQENDSLHIYNRQQKTENMIHKNKTGTFFWLYLLLAAILIYPIYRWLHKVKN